MSREKNTFTFPLYVSYLVLVEFALQMFGWYLLDWLPSGHVLQVRQPMKILFQGLLEYLHFLQCTRHVEYTAVINKYRIRQQNAPLTLTVDEGAWINTARLARKQVLLDVFDVDVTDDVTLSQVLSRYIYGWHHLYCLSYII